VLDDKFDLSPKLQIIWPVLASAVVVIGGVSIEKITNPFGGYIVLSGLASASIIFIWLLGMIYTTKLLDGVDGLVGGVVMIGGCIIFLFTITDKYYQPDISYASLILVGVSLGFLVLNWNPAKIFLGESGSSFLGFILGVLAIISGGKIAIALLVMALPIMDVVWTIVRRVRSGKNPFRSADRKHLHHRLLDLGLGHKNTALVYYLFAGSFGLLAIFMQNKGKLFALLFLIFFMIFLVLGLNYIDKERPVEYDN
jgi:UDP-GlcNAc:undecaprenyl-phosphate/decaprenyl-phosphate GlcNAc-1-phosphate transferase